MFDNDVESILNKMVAEKKYWIETIIASKECLKNRANEMQNMNEIMKMFATVPD